MNKPTLKHIIYGSLTELLEDPKYYYYSVGGRDYSNLTKDGERAVVDLLNEFAYNILKVRREEDEQRSRDIVLNELKGKHDY